MIKPLMIALVAASMLCSSTSCTKKHCITFTDANGVECCEKCFATQKRLDDFVADNTKTCPDVCD